MHNLLKLELSSSCLKHLKKSGDDNENDNDVGRTILNTKEKATIQYIIGHAVHKTYTKLRRSKHCREDLFQKSIQFFC